MALLLVLELVVFFVVFSTYSYGMQILIKGRTF